MEHLSQWQEYSAMILRTVTYPDKEMLHRREQGKKKEAEDEGRDGIKMEKKKRSENEVLHIKDDRGSYSSLPI